MSLMDDFLLHYGTKEHSGRYPFGSGNRPYQHGIPLVNPGRTVGQDIISGIKKGINIAAPLYIVGKTHLAILSAKSILNSAGISASTVRKSLSSVGIFTPKDALDFAKKILAGDMEALSNLGEETAKNVAKSIK